jgi:hypothetical protein
MSCDLRLKTEQSTKQKAAGGTDGWGIIVVYVACGDDDADETQFWTHAPQSHER